MNGFLLDTNAISKFSPSKADPSHAFVSWIAEQEKVNGLYLSAVTLHELEKGACLLEQRGATARATGIRRWLLGLVAIYADNILSFDATVARVSGELEALAISAGHSAGAADGMIAGTAKAHSLTVITNNLKHFEPFGIAVITPDRVAP